MLVVEHCLRPKISLQSKFRGRFATACHAAGIRYLATDFWQFVRISSAKKLAPNMGRKLAITKLLVIHIATKAFCRWLVAKLLRKILVTKLLLLLVMTSFFCRKLVTICWNFFTFHFILFFHFSCLDGGSRLASWKPFIPWGVYFPPTPCPLTIAVVLQRDWDVETQYNFLSFLKNLFVH